MNTKHRFRFTSLVAIAIFALAVPIFAADVPIADTPPAQTQTTLTVLTDNCMDELVAPNHIRVTADVQSMLVNTLQVTNEGITVALVQNNGTTTSSATFASNQPVNRTNSATSENGTNFILYNGFTEANEMVASYKTATSFNSPSSSGFSFTPVANDDNMTALTAFNSDEIVLAAPAVNMKKNRF